MDMEAIASDPHYAARRMIAEVDGTPMQALIARLSATPGALRSAGRPLDADGDEIRAHGWDRGQSVAQPRPAGAGGSTRSIVATRATTTRAAPTHGDGERRQQPERQDRRGAGELGPDVHRRDGVVGHHHQQDEPDEVAGDRHGDGEGPVRSLTAPSTASAATCTPGPRAAREANTTTCV